MKKLLSIICCIGFILSSVMLAVPASGIIDSSVDNTSIEEFAEDMSELYAEEIEEGKGLEESVACRVIVKATHQPDTYKNAECVVRNNKLYIYQYSDAETAQKAVEYYNELPYVKWAELDGIVESQALSYGNYMIQGDEAKEYVVNNNIPMNEVIVAVLDTGANCYDETWEGRVIDSGYNLSDTGTPNSVETEHRHGSHVTSVIFDNTPDNVKLVEYKTLNCYGVGTNLSVALGIELAVDDGADVINISSASNTFSNVLYEAVQYAYSKNVVVVCAAGNEGADVMNSYPAAFDEVFAVGSIDQKGNHSFFSNFGEEIDFVAPGHNIEFQDSTDDYGTSFSAPFVSATAAMVLAVSPELSINQVKNILIESSVPYEELFYHDGFHVIEDYDYSDDNAPKEALIEDMASDESLYYGYGMPQIQNAIGIVLGYEKAIKPEISVESGTYHDEFKVTISAPEGYEIYYTTDEVYPTKDTATLYSSPINISGSQSIRTVAYSPEGMKSVHNTAEYRMLFYADEKDFTIDSDGYLLSYTGELKEFIVPETINGITVTGIGKEAIRNDNIVSVVFPETLTDIAYYGLYVRNAIYISAKGLVNVGDSGILGINVVEFDAPNIETVGSMILGVREINFPKLTEIGKNAFSTFKHLKYAELPLITQLPAYAFKNCNVLWEVNCPMVTSIDFGAFANCYWLKKLNTPNVKEFISTIRITPAVKHEDLGTFSRCINLIKISFPNVVTIENCRLFNRCYNLTSISLPKAETICDEAFIYCENLISVFIPKVKIVGNNAFAETYSLKNVRLPNAKKIGNYAFKNSSIESLIAPELETIGKYCFTYYDILRETHHQNTTFNSLNAPNLKTTADYAFAYTGALTKLELPYLTDLGKNAFFESSVSYFDATKLKNASSLPTSENSIAILSSEFSECSLDVNGYSLTIYGTPDTYAQTYAEQNGLSFVTAPAIINDLPSEYFEGSLTFDVAGFNKIYRWFGTNNENGTGVKLLTTSTTEKELDPSEYDYKYYFCIVISRDNKYIRSVRTSLCQNMLYSSTPSSDARITIATPSERTIRYGESIVLYTNATGLPEGAKIKWRIVEGSGVKLDPSASGKTCTVTSKSNGNVTIEAYAVDKNGNTIANENGNRICDREGVSSEVSLWWIILYYIRQVFSITNIAFNSLI